MLTPSAPLCNGFSWLYNLALSHEQLSSIDRNPDSNREWKGCCPPLAVSIWCSIGVRVGSTLAAPTGAGGLWARWESYVARPSGGNKLLKKLIGRSATRHRHFQFSILRVLEPGASKGDVIGHEVLVKQKLGSRTFGLNSN